MSILGSLIVSLEAQTASFISGMDAASKSASRTGRDIKNAFSDIGDVAETALAPFGEMGEVVAATIGKLGSSAGSAIESFGKMGGALGGIAAVAGGAAAALGTVSIAAVALAAHTAETIAKIGDLSRSSGVSVEALSGLGFAGKSAGLSIEDMASSLEKMDRAVLKAATSPRDVTNAFSRLGISIRDSSGQIKPTEELFGELADRFASMPDGLAKTGFAMQIFGRSGAQMIPVLDRGKAGIQELLETAQSLGVVLDDKTVNAAARFNESLVTIEAAGEGLSIRLTQSLLPALQTVSDQLVNGLKDKKSGLSDLTAGVSYLTKAFLTAGEIIWKVLQTIGAAIGDEAVLFIELGSASQKAMNAAVRLDWGGIVAAWKDGQTRMTAVSLQGADDIKKIWGEAGNFIHGVWAPLSSAPNKPKLDNSSGNTEPKADALLLSIQARIKELHGEAAAWLEVSQAGTSAEQLVAKAVTAGNTELQKMRDSAAKDVINPAGALAIVAQNEAMIKSDAAIKVFGQSISTLNASLDKQREKLLEEAKAASDLATAYRQGDAAIAAAAIGKQFASDAGQLDTLIEARKLLTGTRTGAQMLGPLAPEAAEYKQLSDAIDTETKALTANRAAASAVAAASLAADIARQTASFTELAPHIAAVSAAYLKGVDAIRAARVELELYQWQQEQLAKGVNPASVTVTVTNRSTGQDETMTALEAERLLLQQKSAEEYDATIKQQAAQYDLNVIYQDSVVKLQAMQKAIEDAGDSTLLIDAKLFDAQNNLVHQWDQAAIAVGTFGQRYQAVMNELVIQGKDAGAEITKAFMSAIDDAESQLAKLFTGQKTSFKKVGENLLDTVVKSQIQSEVGKVAATLGIKLPGSSGNKPTGTESDPFFVAFAHAHGLPTLSGGGAAASATPGAPVTPWSDLDSVLGGSGGGFLGRLRSLFSGSQRQQSPITSSATTDGSQVNPYYVLDATTGLSVGVSPTGEPLSSQIPIAKITAPSAAAVPASFMPGVPSPSPNPEDEWNDLAMTFHGLAGSTVSASTVVQPQIGGTQSNPFYVLDASTGLSVGVSSTGQPLNAQVPVGDLTSPLTTALTHGFTPGPPSSTTGPNGAASALAAMGFNSFAGGGAGGIGGNRGRAPSQLFGLLSNPLQGMTQKWLTGLLSSNMGSTASLAALDEEGALADAAASTATTAGTGAADLMGGAEGGGIGSDAFSDLFDFGGFMASGGDVMPGKAYVVGEKHPELFMPGTAGRILPQIATTNNRQQTRNTNIVNNFNVPAPVDLFKKSSNQINSEQSRQISMANSRN